MIIACKSDGILHEADPMHIENLYMNMKREDANCATTPGMIIG